MAYTKHITSKVTMCTDKLGIALTDAYKAQERMTKKEILNGEPVVRQIYKAERNKIHGRDTIWDEERLIHFTLLCLRTV